MAQTQLREAGIAEYENDSMLLMEYCFDMDKTDLFMNRDREMDDYHCEAYLEAVCRRSGREPLQYITGSQCFMGIDLKVNPDVLIPRQDTERLVGTALERIKGSGRKWNILDLCCGSGAIGIALARLCPEVRKVTLSDISGRAVETAAANAEAAGTAKKCEFLTGDLFEPLKRRARFDMITVNPPYIPAAVIETLEAEVRDHEPRQALDGGDDGLDFYRRLIPEAPERLERDGVLIMEIGHDQAGAVTGMLEAGGKFADMEIVRDYGGNERIIVAVRRGKC